MEKKYVVLTGATGFLGNHLLKVLINNNYHVIGVTRENRKGISPKKNPSCRWVRPSELSNHILKKKVFAAIHLATNYGHGKKIEEVITDNVLFPLDVFSICVENDCSLFLTTDTFFGKLGFDYPHMRPYIQSKNDLVSWLKIFYGRNPSARIFNLRLEHIYGEGDRAGKFIPDLICDLKSNKKIIHMTSGEQMRDFIHVEDVMSAYLKTLTFGKSKQPSFHEYEIGTGVAVSVKFLACMLRDLIGSKSQLNFGALPQRDGEIMYSTCSRAFSDDFSWVANVNLELGLKKLLANACPMNFSA